MTDDFNDNLDDLLGGAPRNTPSRAPETFVPAAERVFTEKCPACRGTGKFHSWSGRVVGDCFKCKGRGERTFKNSAESRANTRQKAADRKERNRQADLQAWAERNKAEHAWLVKAAAQNALRRGTFGFPQAMLDAVKQWGDLTDRQLAKVQELVAKDAARAAQPDRRQDVDASKLEQAFARATAAAAREGQVGVWVKPLSLKSGDHAVTFQPGSTGSKWEGMIFVKSGDKKLGSIQDGKFRPRFECSDAEKAAIVDCCNDPAKAAVAFGKAFGVCAICHRTLLNDESIARGIGPICAEKFGF